MQRIVARILHELDEAAQFWLGVSRPEATNVLAACHWSPDELSAYCSRCGSSVGPGEQSEKGCSTCRNRTERRIGDGIIRLGPYTEDLREWVLATKYGQWHQMAEALGRHLAFQVRRSGLVDVKRAVVVPMPMPWQRRLFRGIDHARVLARTVASGIGGTFVPILARSNGPTQASLEPGQRKANAGRGLRIRWRPGGWPLEELDVVLVDDVRTTGASLRAAVRLLRELNPNKIVAAVAAVSDESARRARQGGADSPDGDAARADGGPPRSIMPKSDE